MQQNGLKNISVINEAADGNQVFNDAFHVGVGPSLISRYPDDAISHRGAKYIMVFEGLNDIITTGTDESSQTEIGNRLIYAYEQIASDCKPDLLLFAATITPFGGSSYAHPAREATRQKVNEWIMTTGTFNVTIDFASIAGEGDKLKSDYDSGDHIHLNVAGYQQLADQFPLDIFN